MTARLPVDTLNLYGGIPNPATTARGLIMHRPDLVRMLLAAYRQGNGYRVEGWSQTESRVAELRSLGIVEARGANRQELMHAPAEFASYAEFDEKFPLLPREPGSGYFLTGYGNRVRRALLDNERVETA